MRDLFTNMGLQDNLVLKKFYLADQQCSDSLPYFSVLPAFHFINFNVSL